MDKQTIQPFDIHRMIFGDAPPIYYLEVFFRGLALYLFMIFIMRLLGKRMAGKLTVTEMVLVVTLGASVAVAMQVPEGGVLLGFVVLTCALLFERSISLLTIKSARFETVSQGCADVLVKDGVIQLNKLNDTKITRDQLFANLRNSKIKHLGQIERIYLEAGGNFSIFKVAGDTPPGLPVFPDDDKELLENQKKATDVRACYNCGLTTTDLSNNNCSNCHSNRLTNAVY